MSELPDYLQGDYEILKKAFPQKISEEELEILILLIHENYSQRNLARLLSKTFDFDYHYVLNAVFGAGSNRGERNRTRLEVIKKALLDNNFDREIYP